VLLTQQSRVAPILRLGHGRLPMEYPPGEVCCSQWILIRENLVLRE
jgi:hypothetical protein